MSMSTAITARKAIYPKLAVATLHMRRSDRLLLATDVSTLELPLLLVVLLLVLVVGVVVVLLVVVLSG